MNVEFLSRHTCYYCLSKMASQFPNIRKLALCDTRNHMKNTSCTVFCGVKCRQSLWNPKGLTWEHHHPQPVRATSSQAVPVHSRAGGDGVTAVTSRAPGTCGDARGPRDAGEHPLKAWGCCAKRLPQSRRWQRERRWGRRAPRGRGRGHRPQWPSAAGAACPAARTRALRWDRCYWPKDEQFKP